MKTIKFLFVCSVMVSLISCNNSGITKKPLKTEVDTVSYALGLDMGIKVKSNFSEIDKDLFVNGFINGLDSTDMKFEPKEISLYLNKFFQKKQQEAMAKRREEATKKAEIEFADVKLAGEKFIEENKTAEGVKVTDSGLQYIVLKEGTGEKPTAKSKVKVHYHGTLVDGTVFDSSVDRGKPSEFGVSQVIKGWTEGLQLMNVGSKYKFFIPQELAYGSSPRKGGVIKPFMPLIFEVELLEIVK